MRLINLKNCVTLAALVTIAGCVTEPAKTGYSKSQVETIVESEAAPHDSLLVFRTSGYRAWEDQNAEFLVNGDPIAFFRAGGASYLPLQAGNNIVMVREPNHFLSCELEFEFEPGTGQFLEIYERFDPGAMLMSFILADLHSRLTYDPHPGTKCAGVYGLSMGYLKKDQLADVQREFSFQVVRR
jgi:hypothetical protein